MSYGFRVIWILIAGPKLPVETDAMIDEIMKDSIRYVETVCQDKGVV